MTTQPLSEELASMHALMDNTRFAAMENGRYLVVWGLALSLGVAYSEAQNAWRLALTPWVVWIALLASAWLYTILAKRWEQQKARAKSFAGRLLANEWMTCGLSMTIAFVGGGLFGAVPSGAIAGLAATFLAIPIMATGRLAHVRWLTYVGVLWWVAGLALFAIPPAATGVVMLVSLLGLFVLPGVVLSARARKLPSRMS
jgi:hypothetical protein